MATINGTSFNNILYGTSFNDIINGFAGNDVLYGGAGNDILDGGLGNDKMYGGTGNDTYYVNSMSDSVIEYAGQGIDKVISSVSTNIKWLPSNVENLTLTGTAIYGDGNDLANVIIGNASNNYLYGYGGNDVLYGGAGNDTLHGGDGNDILVGGSGNDTLTGGLGADKFRFNYLNEGVDIIKDFSWQQGDKIQIYKAGFGATSTNQFSYNSSTGGLFYDPAGLVGPTRFATLENKPSGFSVNLDIEFV